MFTSFWMFSSGHWTLLSKKWWLQLKHLDDRLPTFLTKRTIKMRLLE